VGSIRIPCPYLEWIDRFDPHADGGDELSVPQTDDQRGQATLLGSHAPSRGKPSVHRVAELETRPKRIFTMSPTRTVPVDCEPFSDLNTPPTPTTTHENRTTNLVLLTPSRNHLSRSRSPKRQPGPRLDLGISAKIGGLGRSRTRPVHREPSRIPEPMGCISIAHTRLGLIGEAWLVPTLIRVTF
jgi:hypothetical protein